MRLFSGFPFLELLLGFEVFPRHLIDYAHRKAYLATVIEAEQLHFDLVAFLDDIRGFGDPSLGELGDVDETVFRAEEIHEGAEIDYLHDRTLVDLTDFRIVRDGFDPIDCGADRIAVGGGDLHGAVVLNIDLGAGFFDDLANDLAAGADHFADLVGRNLQGLDARREFTKFRPRPGERLAHFAQNMQPARLRLIQGDPHDLFVDAGDLDVHL